MTTTLSEFKQKAKQAHNWTSFVPEKRGEQLINGYENQLNEDIETLKANGIDNDVIEAYVTRYKFTDKFCPKAVVKSTLGLEKTTHALCAIMKQSLKK